MKHENANRVFLLNKDGKPIMPCRPRKARQLTENLEEADLDDMKGFCHHCGSYFNVEHVDEKGFWFRG